MIRLLYFDVETYSFSIEGSIPGILAAALIGSAFFALFAGWPFRVDA